MPRAREIVNIVQAIRGNLNQISIQNSPQCFIVIFHITICEFHTVRFIKFIKIVHHSDLHAK